MLIHYVEHAIKVWYVNISKKIDQSKAQCVLCSRILKMKHRNTSALSKHLQSKYATTGTREIRESENII